MVCAIVGSATWMGWKRRSRAASFSRYLRYSSSVVAPIVWSSPRASIGLSMDAASIAPSAAPAPTSVWISSMNRMMSPRVRISLSTFFRRSSKSPRYREPATSAPRSSVYSCLSLIVSGTSPLTIFCASPSTTAVLPTPGAPTRTGLFLVRRDSTCMTRSISFSRPITGSSLPSRAPWVRFRPNWSSTSDVDGADSVDPLEVRAKLDKDLGGNAVAFPDQAKQDVLGPDVVVTELQRLTQRKLKHFLRTGGERDVPGRCLLALADDLLDLLPHRLKADPKRLKRLGRNTLALVDEAEQDVLRANVVVIEHPGFFLRQDNNPPRPVGEPLEHVRRSPHSGIRQVSACLPAPHGSRVPDPVRNAICANYRKLSPDTAPSPHPTAPIGNVVPSTPPANALSAPRANTARGTGGGGQPPACRQLACLVRRLVLGDDVRRDPAALIHLVAMGPGPLADSRALLAASPVALAAAANLGAT